MLLCSTLCIFLGFSLDGVLGDPHGWPHIVILYGKLISFLEKKLYDRMDRFRGGMVLWICVVLAAAVSSGLLLFIAWKIHFVVYIVVGTLLCWQCLAAKSLVNESRRVYTELKENGLEAGRKAVSWIVGRDTDVLDEAGVIKAAVETVAENTSDGEIAPMFYMMIFGPVGGCVYKAVNTMDSMIGYRNERYEHFGTFAAKADDVFNFIPARLSALLLIVAAKIGGFDGEGAARIWKRDRRKHASPNSAQTESVMAGALQVQLAGDAVYGGVVHKKEFIGDDIRPIEADDIFRSNTILMLTSWLSLIAVICVRLIVMIFAGYGLSI